MIRTLLLFALLLSALSSSADEDSKVIKIVAGEWPPFIGEKLENFGYVGEKVQRVFASQGYRVEFHFLPWKRAYKKASEGEYVATAVWMYAEERTEHFYFSSPVAQEQFVFFHLKETPFRWQSLSDVEGQHLGGGLGYSYGKGLDQLIETQKVRITRVEDPTKAFQLLKYRRVSLVPEEKHIGMFTLSRLPTDMQDLITYHPKPFLSNNSYLMFSKSHPKGAELLAIFNQGLMLMENAQ